MLLKKNFVHFFIVVLCILYIFISNYVANNLLKIEGEAELIKANLPNPSNQLSFHIDGIEENRRKWKDFIVLNGWAFSNELNDSNEKSIYIVFKSDKNTYIFNTKKNPGWNVSDSYGNKIEDSGFSTFISKGLIKNGVYRVGIYLTSNGYNYYSPGNVYFTKNNNVLFEGFISKEQRINMPLETNNILFGIEEVSEHHNTIKIRGWAFINGLDYKNSNTYIVLTSEGKNYIFDTVDNKRLDVTNHFQELNLNLDNSGFLAYIPKEKLEKSVYNIGIYIKSDDSEGFQFTDKYINIASKKHGNSI